MPGNVILRPLEANLTRNATIGKMSPYYVLNSGSTKIKSQVCKKAGKSPAWQEPVSLQRTADSFCMLEVRTKRALLPDKMIGSCQINLDDLTEEKSQKWYDIMHKNKVAGKVLIEACLAPGVDGQPEIVIASDLGMAVPAVATQSVNMLGDGTTTDMMGVDANRYISSLGNIPSKDPLVEFRAGEVMEQPLGQSFVPVTGQVENLIGMEMPNATLPQHSEQIVMHDNRLMDGEGSTVPGVRVRHTAYIVDSQDVYQTDPVVGDFNLEDIPLERSEDEEIRGRVVFTK